MTRWLVVGAGLVVAGSARADCREPSVDEVVGRFEAMVAAPTTSAMLAYADCLAAMGWVHAAQRHYLEVARSGPEPGAWRNGLEGAMSLVDATGDPLSVQPYLRGVDVRAFGGVEGRGPWYDAMLFVNGQQLAADGQFELAAVRLDEVSEGSPWFAAAQLAQAKALESAGRGEAALERYSLVPDGPFRSEALARAALLLARTQRAEEALAALDALADDPSRDGFTVPLRARLLLQQGQAEEARAEAARAVRVARERYAPDAWLVVAQVAAADCRVRAAGRALERHEATWAPVLLALDAGANVGNSDGLRFWEAWLGPDPVDWDLPGPVRAEVSSPQPARAWLEGHLARVDTEAEQIGLVDDARFQAIVRPHLDEVLGDGRDQLRSLLGQEVQRRMRDLHAGLVRQRSLGQGLREQVSRCGGDASWAAEGGPG